MLWGLRREGRERGNGGTWNLRRVRRDRGTVGIRKVRKVRKVWRFGGKWGLLRHAYKDSVAKNPLQLLLCNQFFGLGSRDQSCLTKPSCVIQSSATSCGSWPWTSTFAFRSCATVLFSFFVTGSMTSAICGYFFRALELMTGAAL